MGSIGTRRLVALASKFAGIRNARIRRFRARSVSSDDLTIVGDRINLSEQAGGCNTVIPDPASTLLLYADLSLRAGGIRKRRSLKT